MPLKMTRSEVPSFILHSYIIPLAEQCYLISIEYRYVDLNRLLILLLKDCSHVNGVIHMNLNNVVNNLVERYKVFDVNRDWVVQATITLIHRELQSYFYNRAEFSLAPPKP